MSFFNHNPFHAALDQTLGRARRHLKSRRAIQGLALWAGLTLLLAIVTIVWMNEGRFADDVVAAGRRFFFTASGIGFVVLVVSNLFLRRSNRAMATYVEDQLPELGGRISTAVDVMEGRDISSSKELGQELVKRSVADHRGALETIEQPRTRFALGVTAALVALALLAVMASPLQFRFGAGLLSSSAHDGRTANPYAVRVKPGNTQVIEGADLQVQAETVGFITRDIELLVRADENADWSRSRMSVATDASGSITGYDSFMFDIGNAREYAVEADGIRSPVYRVDVIRRPDVERIDLVFDYPRRTGRAPDRMENQGDIRAVKGTRVRVEVTPDQPVERGELVLNGEQRIALELKDGKLQGELTVSETGQYRIELPAGDTMAPASGEYAIAALDDGLPAVRIRAPGRDARVTMVEEVEFQVDAADDVMVSSLELVMSVNGEAEQVIPLESGNSRELKAIHTEFLEQRALEPGDMISYFARVSDATSDATRSVSTDIYFLDIRPFGQTFRAGGSGGGGGGGGGGEQRQNDLSAQQRSLVIALFKLTRDRDELEDAVANERVETLNQAQDRIRDRVDAIVRRLKSRRIVEETPGVRQMTEELPKAAKAMREVTAWLDAGDIDAALAPSRKALAHLQRADAAFREVRVAQNRGQGGSGGGSATGDMSNLFRLEMDKFRNQYADLQRGQPEQQQQQAIDETMRKLRELSQRQIEELERSISRAGQNNGTGTDSQARLADQVDEILDELRRLTRRKNSQALRDSMRKLEDAARNMRESSESGDQDATRRALDSLREARRALEDDRREAKRSTPERSAEDLREIMRRMQSTRNTMRQSDQQGNQARQTGEQPGQQNRQARQPGTQQGAPQDGAGQQPGQQPGGQQTAGTRGQQPGQPGGDDRNTGRTGGGGAPDNPARDARGNGERGRIAGGARIDADLDDLREAIRRQADSLGPVSNRTRADNPEAAGNIESVIESLNSLADSGDLATASERYDALLRELQVTERALREHSDAEVIVASRRVEPGEDSRDAVERYYRSLSEPDVREEPAAQ